MKDSLAENIYQIQQRAMERLTIANQAILKAQEENKRHGIPEFFFKNGVIYYVLESGEVTTKRPEKDQIG